MGLSHFFFFFIHKEYNMLMGYMIGSRAARRQQSHCDGGGHTNVVYAQQAPSTPPVHSSPYISNPQAVPYQPPPPSNANNGQQRNIQSPSSNSNGYSYAPINDYSHLYTQQGQSRSVNTTQSYSQNQGYHPDYLKDLNATTKKPTSTPSSNSNSEYRPAYLSNLNATTVKPSSKQPQMNMNSYTSVNNQSYLSQSNYPPQYPGNNIPPQQYSAPPHQYSSSNNYQYGNAEHMPPAFNQEIQPPSYNSSYHY